jgi:hypothetical protein
MSRKPIRLPRILPLQRIVSEGITDPAELAAIDRMRQRLKREAAAQAAGRRGNGRKARKSRTG